MPSEYLTHGRFGDPHANPQQSELDRRVAELDRRVAEFQRQARFVSPAEADQILAAGRHAQGHVQGSASERKAQPIASGCLDYFPDALLAVAELSRIGNEQHNPGKPLHWDRSKSGDEADALLRHLVDRGTVDTDGVRHSAKVAWRALALLQKEIEAGRSQDGKVIPLAPAGPVKPAWWGPVAQQFPGLRFATTAEVNGWAYDERTGRDRDGDVWVAQGAQIRCFKASASPASILAELR